MFRNKLDRLLFKLDGHEVYIKSLESNLRKSQNKKKKGKKSKLLKWHNQLRIHNRKVALQSTDFDQNHSNNFNQKRKCEKY